jgi:precorrin-6Y C5,15-methyltransferase (decarboxylating)
VGIGEDGVEGLSATARSLLCGAECIVGGQRHLDMLDERHHAVRMPWPKPFSDAANMIRPLRGQPVVVLASGDPFDYGVGNTLVAEFPMEELLCVPAPSAFSLACARLGWSRQDTRTLSFCGRPIAPLIRALQPGRRILALSADGRTPAAVAQCLRDRGFGRSGLHILEGLGGARERITSTTADEFVADDVQPLNLLAIEVCAGPDARTIPLARGLDDELFDHDGQITKREIRALTLSALAPRAGELLWDIGCGSGSVSIEWLMCHDANRAIAIEARHDRAQRAARNALALGTPELSIVEGEAPQALRALARPDAVFLGGGAHLPGVIDAVWEALRSGGRLVANAVVIETESALIEAHLRLGGTLSRLSVERLDTIGRFHAFRPAFTVTQWRVEKS